MLLHINKPAGITSHDVVDEVRKITGERRVGHAGTLDPFTTGVLVIGVGRESTKKLGNISKNSEKEYIAILKLGKISSTGDPEGIIEDFSGRRSSLRTCDVPKLRVIERVLEGFKGKIKQRPPKFSAIKIKGEPAYKKARRGEEFEISEREVEIKKIEVMKYISPPHLKIRVVCGSGTYIRSLARDIGEALGTGAYLTELTRTRVGDYKIENSKTLEELEESL